MVRTIFILLIIGLANYTSAQSTKSKSVDINFRIKKIGKYINGTFNRAHTDIFLDTVNLEKSYLNITINVKSINTNKEKRDLQLSENTEYFYANKYPTIKLNSTKISKLNSNGYTVEWNLTMKGVSKKVESNLYISETISELKLFSTLRINRRKWDIGQNSFFLSDFATVEITTQIEK